MIPLENSLRQLFHEVVSECYDSRLGLRDAEISSYVADLLTEFCRAENIYRIRDAAGNPVREVGEMLLASDPVHGTASSFGEERDRRNISATTPCFSPACIRRRPIAGADYSTTAFSKWSRRGKRATTSFPSSTCLSTQGGAILWPALRFLRSLHLWTKHGARGTRPAQGDLSAPIFLLGPGDANHVASEKRALSGQSPHQARGLWPD